MAKKSLSHSIDNRKKAREDIAQQIQDFLKDGGEIEVVSSAFDRVKDPKCRLGEEMGLFV